jgi:outer membrane protein TolC
MAEAPDEQTVLQRAVGGRAELQEARHHLLHMQAQRRLARAGWFPDLMVQYSAVETPGGPPTAMAMAKVSLPFVWFWRQGADVDAAARMADQARVEAEGMERETRAMVRTEVGALDTARRQRDRILRETLPLADQALHLGVSGYRSGTVGVADALSAVKAYQAARLMAVGITAQCGRSRAALDQLTGDRPESDFDKEHLHHDE